MFNLYVDEHLQQIKKSERQSWDTYARIFSSSLAVHEKIVRMFMSQSYKIH